MPQIKLYKGMMVLDGYHPTQADMMMLECGEALQVEVRPHDQRMITDRQRKFIFALCRDIAFYTGNDAEWERMLMQQYNANLRDIEVISLSKASVSYANGLIDTIIDYCIDKEIPMTGIQEYGYDFNDKQTYAMCLRRVCAICGQRADIHHVDRVGMGFNRAKMSHIGKRVLPLCRQHHMLAHQIGDERMIERYHLEPVEVDDQMNSFIKKGKLRIYDTSRENTEVHD